jgi:alkylated DNA repair dioxygenase AlkB
VNRLPLPDAEVYLLPALDLGAPPAALLTQLTHEIDWQSETITLWGKTYPQPRLIAWHGDPDARYTYSKKTYAPRPWTPLLLDLKTRVESACGAPFNSVLLNHYRNERDSMGFHADDEPELGERPVIASLSLGAERALIFQHKTRKDIKPVSVVLSSGSFLVMQGETQAYWKHGIRKQTRVCGPRINLTFRKILPK